MIPVGLIAGGHGSRLGTPHKCLVDLGGGVCALDLLLAACAGVAAGPVMISTNDAAPFAARGLATVPDRWPGAGPLAGVDAVLAHHAAAPAVLILAADQPGVRTADLALLLTAWRACGRLVVGCGDDGRMHPLLAVVPTALAPGLSSALAAGHRAVHRYWAEHAPHLVSLNDVTLSDLDDADDLARWRERLLKN